MISFKWWRWIQVHLRGARSFQKENWKGYSRILVRGETKKVALLFKDMGYEEEWPL